MSLLQSLFGPTSKKEIKKIQPIADKVLSLESKYETMSDEELSNMTNVLKAELENGKTLDDILPDAFAVCREASWRVLGMKHFPVQILGGIILHQGRIAEMKTGEGKTLVATLPVYLNALSGKGVHVVTVNDYLAKRDSNWMGKVYGFLGLTTGLILTGGSQEEKRYAYSCDITYGTNNEFGFDYLKDNMVINVNDRVQRGFNYAIVDEIDSILIDDARTPLIISGVSGKSDELYIKANDFFKTLKGKIIVQEERTSQLDTIMNGIENQEEDKYKDYDYVAEEKKRTVVLTERGISKAERYFGVNNFGDMENMELQHYVNCALKANTLFRRDIEYIVSNDGEIVIVDEKTGRLMDGRRYSNGIHQAIEAKENVAVNPENKTLASITFQNLFRKYNKLCGMTGTAKTEEEEFGNTYRLDIVEIPTNKPIQRIDKQDKVYTTERAKIKAIIEQVKECNKNGQPILIGTASVEKSEMFSEILKKEGIKHTVLNAKYHEKEAKIVSQAGRLGAVTIATNMAGRGTDILLGGNPEFMAIEEMENEGFSKEIISEANSFVHTTDEEILNARKVLNEKVNKIKESLAEEVKQVREVGGLYILGTERHESRRVDNQLRGRAGRQGDVGVSEFMISLEDDLMRIFGADRVTTILSALNANTDEPVEQKILANAIEKAQKNIEATHTAQRKTTLEYDDVITKQRDLIYSERNKILENKVDEAFMIEFIKSYVNNNIKEFFLNPKKPTLEEYMYLVESFSDFGSSINLPEYSESDFNNIKVEDISNKIFENIGKAYLELKELIPEESLHEYEQKVLLFYIDTAWQDHMITLDELKQGSGLAAYGQKDPKIAFTSEAFEAFDRLLEYIKRETIKNLLKTRTAKLMERNDFNQMQSSIRIDKTKNIAKITLTKEMLDNMSEAQLKELGAKMLGVSPDEIQLHKPTQPNQPQ